MFFLSWLSDNIYAIDFLGPIKKNPQRKLDFLKRAFKRVAHSIIYTSIVFFGLKMSLDKFNEKATENFALLGYLLSIYVIGLFCTGYLVNILLVK